MKGEEMTGRVGRMDGMGDLAEFLLACFAEDEAPTWTLMPYDCEPGCCAPEGWVGVQCRYCDPAPVYGGTVEAMTRSAEDHAEAIHQRSHVLADRAAKRRIVEDVFPDVVAMTNAYVDATDESPGIWPWAADRLLMLLALPYADHEGFRDEWRA